jgi:hypothetical protein
LIWSGLEKKRKQPFGRCVVEGYGIALSKHLERLLQEMKQRLQQSHTHFLISLFIDFMDRDP